MKKLLLLLIPSLLIAANEPINVNSLDGKVKQTSSTVGSVAKPFDFSSVNVIGIGGGGGAVSITGTAPIVVTPSPLTGTGVISINTSGFEVPITFSLSLVRATNNVTLVNDSASPGASKYYGTDGTSTKGWFALPAGGGVTSWNTRTGAVVPATNDYNFNQLAGIATTAQGGAPTAGLSGQVLKKNSNTNYDYSWAADATGGGTGVTSVGLAGTANEITVTGTSPITTSGTWTLDIPSAAQLDVAKLTNLITNGFVKTGATDGTLSVDTSTYLTSASISDTAYASSWDGVTTIAPSKNAIRDWGFIFDPDYDGKVEVLDLGAGLVKTSAGGVVSTAVAGTDYLTGNQAITLTGDVTGGPSATSIATTYTNVVPTSKGGVPTAGAINYVLTKLSALNYDYGWLPAAGGGAPTGVDYLVGTADGTLSAEIVVGTSPGGELGGTWASPTLDDGITVANWTLTTPQIAAISNLTTNGIVNVSGGIGTLGSGNLSGDVTTAGTLATTIGANKVTLGMMATMATDSILGRATASTGNVEVLTSLPFAWSGGDVARSADSNTETINTNAVTYAKMQDVTATNRFLGRITAGAGDPEELTVANAKTILNYIPVDIGLGNVNNVAQTQAAIVPNTAPSAGQILAGNAGGTAYAPVTVSGSGATISLASTGVMTIGSIANASLDADLAAIGNITGARGDILYYGASGWAKLAGGTDGFQLTTHSTTADPTWAAAGSGGGAPTGVDYLVGTADGTLSAEIVVGTSPGGELGGTWAAPTIDDTLTVVNWTLTTPTISAPNISLPTITGATQFVNGATSSGEIRLYEDSDFGANYASFIVPSLAANTVYTLPPDDGNSGDLLRSDGAGVLTWVAPAVGGNVSNSGTPTVDQLGIWVTATTIKGLTTLPATNFPALTGDVTTTAGALGTTIGANKVTLPMLATMATDSILGRKTAATGNVEELTALPFAYTGDVTRPVDSNVTTLANIPVATTIGGVAGTRGDVLYYGASGWAKLAAGTSGNQLTTNGAGADPTWAAAGGGGGSATFIGLTDVPASYSGSGSKVVAVNSGATALEFVTAPAAGAGGSNTQVQYNNSGTLAGDATLTFDNSTKFVTISTADVNGTAFRVTNTSVGGKVWQFTSIGSGGAAPGNFSFYNGTNTVLSMNSTQIATYAPAMFGWWSDASHATLGSFDTALGRNAAGVVEINNGTAGQYRDLKLRYLYFDNGAWVHATGNRIVLRGNGTTEDLSIDASGLGLRSGQPINWSNSATDSRTTWDVGIARNTAGVVEVNNGTVGTYRDIKVDEVDAVTGYKIGGAAASGKILIGNGTDYVASTPTYPNTAGTNGYELMSNGTNFVSYPTSIFNSSTTSQSPSTSEVYVAGSSVVVGAGDFKAKGQYRCIFDVTKTAGTGGIVVALKTGTAGTTGDTTRISFPAFGAGTSVADHAVFEVVVTWRTVGSGTSAVLAGFVRGTHQLATTGMFSGANVWQPAYTASSGFNSSADTTMGITFTGGTAFSGTIDTVQATLNQP